jgi:hypothetical protein
MIADILEIMGIRGFITYFIFIMALAMGFLLLGLCLWHGRLIGRGETAVEQILDNNYIQQYAQHGFIFVKTHDNSRSANWKRFFGVRNMGEFIRRILLPSTHQPNGNGITMDSCDVHTNLILHNKDSDESKQYIPYYGSSGYHSVSGGYLVSKYRSESSALQKQPISDPLISCYKPRISSIDWNNNFYMNTL